MPKVGQMSLQFPVLTAEENVLLPLELAGEGEPVHSRHTDVEKDASRFELGRDLQEFAATIVDLDLKT